MKILDDYMNAEPLIPLPKQIPNASLESVQLLMLFLLWAVGMALGILAFLVELAVGLKAKQHKNREPGRLMEY